MRIINVINFIPEWYLSYLKYPSGVYFLIRLRNMVLFMHLHSFMCV